MTLADRLVVMHKGKIQQNASAQECYGLPANRFVAGFIGTPGMNLVDGELAHEAGRWVFRGPGLAQPLPDLGPQAASGPACLGIRPEDVVIGDGAVEGQVRLIEQTGHENIVVVEIAEGLRLTGRVAGHRLWRLGEPLRCRVNAANVHVFAAGPTGVRLNAPARGEVYSMQKTEAVQ